MKIEICSDGFEVLASVSVTKKDLTERTWAKHAEIELRKVKREGRSGFDCYMWMSSEHDDNSIITIYEYIEGYLADKEKEVINELENDVEWKETINNLKRFAVSMLKQKQK